MHTDPEFLGALTLDLHDGYILHCNFPKPTKCYQNLGGNLSTCSWEAPSPLNAIVFRPVRSEDLTQSDQVNLSYHRRYYTCKLTALMCNGWNICLKSPLEKKKEMTIARAQDAITMNDSTGPHQAQWPHSKVMMVVYKRQTPTTGPTLFPVPPAQFAWVLLYIVQVDACQTNWCWGKKERSNSLSRGFDCFWLLEVGLRNFKSVKI